MPENNNYQLSMAQVKADLMMSAYGISEAKDASPKMAKSIKGIAAYHLQQACEKMIKIQLYASGKTLNNARIYRHSLKDLLVYAESISAVIEIPDYIDRNKEIITRWEAEGRYDLHLVVRIDTLKRCQLEAEKWYESLIKDGYK